MTKAQQEHIQTLLSRWSYTSGSQEGTLVTQRTIWRIVRGYWMKFAQGLGKANALFLLTIVYVVLIGPAAIVLKVIGKDLLDRKAGIGSTYWRVKAGEKLTIERSKQPF